MAIKKTLREQKSEHNFNVISTTARALFSEYGFERVTVDDICHEANVSKSTFYSHFNSKQDLFMLFAGVDRNTFLKERYAYDETIPFKQLLRHFFFVNFEYNRRDSREYNRCTYVSYIKTFRQEWPKEHFYELELKKLVERGVRENAFKQSLTFNEHFRMLNDWIIGFFIGWSVYPDDAPGVEEMYDNIMNAMIDALIK